MAENSRRKSGQSSRSITKKAEMNQPNYLAYNERRIFWVKRNAMELSKLISEGDTKAVIRYMNKRYLALDYFLEWTMEFRLLDDDCEYPFYPVSEAARHGHLDMMNAMIERGFDPDLSTYDERRPINWAVDRGHLHIVRCLIEDHDVNLNPRDRNEDAPLVIAISTNHIDIVNYLIESGANVNDPKVLHDSVRCCNPKSLKYVLSKGVDVNVRYEYRTTPLFQTVQCDFPYANALVLLDAGADVDAKDEGGNTTFLRAAHEQNVKLMRLLISRGADPNVVNNNEDTVLHMALTGRNMDDDYLVDNEMIKEVITYLVVELGLECLNSRNSQGITPVREALISIDQSVLEILVNYGCNITDEFDMLGDDDKEELLNTIPNCTELFQHWKQLASQPRSLKGIASLKLRRHLGVRLEAAVKELPLPETLKNLVRIHKIDVDV